MRPVAPGACCEGLACLGGEDKCAGLQKHNQKSKSQNQSREETENLRIDGSGVDRLRCVGL